MDVDANAYRQTIDALTARVTGEVNQEEGADFLEYLLAATPIVEAAASVLPPQSGTIEQWARDTPLARSAFDYAGLSIGAAADALHALQLMVIKGGGITSLSGYTLLRQAAEGAALSWWCLRDPTPRGLTAAGLAVAWQDASDRLQFAESVRSESEVAAAKAVRRELLGHGRAQRLLTSNNRTPACMQPRWTRLFEQIQFGEDNLLWYYRSLSGAAHSRAWAQLGMTKQRETQVHVKISPEGNVEPTGVVVLETGPNTTLLGNLLFVTLWLVNLAIQARGTARATPGPPHA